MATTSRIPAQGSPNQDKTSRVLTNALQTPTFASTLALVFTEFYTLVTLAVTGAITINFGVGSATLPPYVGDTAEFLFTNGTAGSITVTLGTGTLVTATTIVIPAGKTANISFMFNGASWVEQSRAITI